MLCLGYPALFSVTVQDGMWQPHNIQGTSVPHKRLSRLYEKEIDLQTIMTNKVGRMIPTQNFIQNKSQE